MFSDKKSKFRFQSYLNNGDDKFIEIQTEPSTDIGLSIQMSKFSS